MEEECGSDLPGGGGGGGGVLALKQTGMLVVSLRGTNFGCLGSLRVFLEIPGKVMKVLVRAARVEI